MKKVLGIATACLLMAALSTSCNKSCTCTTTVTTPDGEVVTTSEVPFNGYPKCSDMNTSVVADGVSNVIKCK